MSEQNPQPSRVYKPWHENLNTEMRKHLIQKIIQTIFPAKDNSIYHDPRLSNLVNYAIRTECEMYEQAKDKDEYFFLLAERIYRVQTEYDRQRMNLFNNNNQNNSSNDAQINLEQPQNESVLNTFQTQLNPLNACNNLDLTKGNEDLHIKQASPSSDFNNNNNNKCQDMFINNNSSPTLSSEATPQAKIKVEVCINFIKMSCF